MPRSRRATAKAVDYSKEQEFSDDDIFEDGFNSNDDEVPTTARRKKSSSSRKSNVASASYLDPESSHDFRGNGVGVGVGAGSGGNNAYDVVDKYRYFERGYDMSLGHIRERFDFMPELEIDGSPKVDLIVGRRLIGEGKEDKQSTTEGENGGIDDEDTGRGKRKRGKGKSKADKKKSEEPAKHHLEYEYLIKYKGKSYLHLEWKEASELESLNKSAKNLYRRYLKKLQNGADEDLEDPDFDPAYIQPQRIVDEDEHEITVELNDEELVEWEKHQAKEMEEESDDEEDEKEKDKEEKSSKDIDGGNAEKNDTKGKLFFSFRILHHCVLLFLI